MTDALRALGIDDPREKRRPVRLAIGTLGLVAVAVASFFVYQRTRAETTQWVTDRVARGDLVTTAVATGSLRPLRTVDVGAELSGRVEAVHVDVNDRVRVGDVLVEIDTDPFAATVSQGRAAVLEAQAAVRLATTNLAEARRRLERTNELSRGGHVADQQLDDARALVARAEAELAAADARTRLASAGLRESTTNLARSVIRSPIDGIVLVRSVEPGQAVAAALAAPTLLVLAEDLTRMELHVDVDEADVGRVREGMTATFTVDAYPNRRFEGRITRVAFAGRPVQNVVSYETVIVVDNTDLALRPGMTANATIVTERRTGVLLVPSAALRFSPRTSFRVGRDRRWDAPRGPTIWTLRNGEPTPLSVELLGSDDTRTEIRGAGVHEGLEVVVDAREVPP